MRKRSVILLSVLAAGLGFATVPSLGQEQLAVAVLGRVYEFGTDAPVNGGTVTARNQQTGARRASITSADGTFFIDSLPPGLYTITAQCEGFQSNSLGNYPIRTSKESIAKGPPIALIPLEKVGTTEHVSSAWNQLLYPRIAQADAPTNGSSVEIRMRWDADAGAPPQVIAGTTQYAAANVFGVTATRKVMRPVPRHRAPQLSLDQILVVAFDARGQQVDWALLLDPRIIRAEASRLVGESADQVLLRSTTEFTVVLPDYPAATELRFYHPRWTGAVFALEVLGTVSFR